MGKAKKLLAVLGALAAAGVFVLKLKTRNSKLEIYTKKILENQNFYSSSQIAAKSSASFPDTYFLADRKKKAIVSQGMILKIENKEVQVPQENLCQWISIELIKKECPAAIYPATKYCSIFDIKTNENAIKNYLSENINLKHFSEPGKKLLIGESALKINKEIEQSEFTQLPLKISLLASVSSAEKIILLGYGQTGFAGSSKDRITNIEIGSSKIDGVVVEAGKEFSALKAIGLVTAETGYKPEANIRGGKTVMALGGGLCQVSSTLFRAALNAGCKIIRRSNHSYSIGYYSPQGTDAAIAYPHTDFKFVNDTGYPIYIQRRIENYQLIFDIYGIDSGRTVKISGPRILEKKEDGSLRTILYQEVYENGKLLRKDSFASFYRPKSEFPHE